MDEAAKIVVAWQKLVGVKLNPETMARHLKVLREHSKEWERRRQDGNGSK